MSYELNLKERGIEFIELIADDCPALPADQKDSLEFFDLCYRTLCSVMFNHASSGHPGGSVSSGRIVQSLVFNRMDYDIGNPMNRTADILSYAAGHKALGLYAMSALRNEVVRLVDPDRLPDDVRQQMRMEDLLGFRRNPATSTPLFVKHQVKALDGHPVIRKHRQRRHRRALLQQRCGNIVPLPLHSARGAHACGCCVRVSRRNHVGHPRVLQRPGLDPDTHLAEHLAQRLGHALDQSGIRIHVDHVEGVETARHQTRLDQFRILTRHQVKRNGNVMEHIPHDHVELLVVQTLQRAARVRVNDARIAGFEIQLALCHCSDLRVELGHHDSGAWIARLHGARLGIRAAACEKERRRRLPVTQVRGEQFIHEVRVGRNQNLRPTLVTDAMQQVIQHQTARAPERRLARHVDDTNAEIAGLPITGLQKPAARLGPDGERNTEDRQAQHRAAGRQQECQCEQAQHRAGADKDCR